MYLIPQHYPPTLGGEFMSVTGFIPGMVEMGVFPAAGAAAGWMAMRDRPLIGVAFGAAAGFGLWMFLLTRT